MPKIPNNRTMGVQYGRALFQPATIDVEAREVDVVFITETLVPRFGWTEDYDELLVCEQQAVRMDRANRGLPLLDCHRTDSVHNQVGRSIRVWINEQKQLCARVKFSQRPEVAGLFQDVVDGIVKDISGGYEIYKYEREERAEGQRPIYRAVDWMPTEISLAPVQADINSEIRTGLTEHSVEIIHRKTSNNNDMKKTRTTEKGKTMQYTVEGGPVKQGDIITVDGVKGVALSDGEEGEEITLTLIENETGADTQETAETAATTAAETIAEAVTEAVAEVTGTAIETAVTEATGTAPDEQERMASILQSTRAAGLPDTFAVDLFGRKNLTVAQCRQAIIVHQSRTNKPEVNGNHGVTVGMDGFAKMQRGIENALLHRIYPSAFKLDAGAREFRTMTMMEIGKRMLTERGINTKTMSRSDIAEAFFTRSHATSDFPQLFGGIINRMLREPYEFAPEYWDLIARQTTVDDFREKGIYTVGVANGMKEVKEGAELQYTSLSASEDKIQIATFGEAIMFTRQAFINDDLGVFELIPGAFVHHWGTLRGNKMWNTLTANAKMADGINLFHADHNNLITGELNEDNLAKAKVALSTQKDSKKQVIRTLPRFLVVAPENEMKAKRLVTITTPTKADDVNIFGGAFDVIVEPRLSEKNPLEWYLMADPKALASLYYAYLDGNEGLRVNSTNEFKTDSMDYAVRGDFGAAAIDFRGIVKSSGK